MKAIFLVDNIPAIEMFMPIIKRLPGLWEVLVINHDGWTKKRRAEIEQALQKLGLDYKTIEDRSPRNVEKLLQEEEPSVVVLPRDTTTHLEQLFIKHANSKHIPTLLVPHGMWAPKERKNWSVRILRAWLKHFCLLVFQGRRVLKTGDFSWSRLIQTTLFRLRRDLKRKPIFDGHGGCSKIAVFGDAMKELLISEGVSPKRIEVTGNPKFDYLYYAKGSDYKSKLCGALGISNDHDIILLLTDYLVESGIWTTQQRKEFVTAVANAAATLPRSKLVIKIHPILETETDYLEIARDLPEPPVICRDTPLPELLSACSLVITVSSTAGLEAMAMAKPLLVLNLFNDVTLFDEASGAMVVRSEGELLPALETALYKGLRQETKEAANKFVYQQAYIQDGKAAKRIADLIIQMAGEAKAWNEKRHKLRGLSGS
jgi:UDP-N-acetylglucosamine 2-epimerase